MYATDRKTSDRQTPDRRLTPSSFNAPPKGAGHNNKHGRLSAITVCLANEQLLVFRWVSTISCLALFSW